MTTISPTPTEASEAFRDDLADVIHDDYDYADPWSTQREVEQRCAAAILAMPEMQAIRTFARESLGAGARDDHRYFLLKRGLPESVIAWVLDE